MRKHRLLIAIVVLGMALVALVTNFTFWRDMREVTAARQLQGQREAVRSATAAEAKAAQASITKQLVAFRSEDYKTAVTLQSTGLRGNFKSVAAFRTMMKEKYPQFCNYQSVVFGPAQATVSGKNVMMPVTLTGKDKIVVKAVYLMVLESGVFRVAGVDGGFTAAPMPPGGPRGRGAPLPRREPPAVAA